MGGRYFPLRITNAPILSGITRDILSRVIYCHVFIQICVLQLKPGCMLPTPESLKYKILVKNKKRKEDLPDHQDSEEKKEDGDTEANPLSGTGLC